MAAAELCISPRWRVAVVELLRLVPVLADSTRVQILNEGRSCSLNHTVPPCTTVPEQSMLVVELAIFRS